MDRSGTGESSDGRVDRFWREFAAIGRVPRKAIREALEDWDALAPAFLARLEAYAADPEGHSDDADAMVVLIHLFGQMRDSRAYRPLITLVSRSPQEAERLLGDVITETLTKIIASVFNGDAAPMQEAILDLGVYDYVAQALSNTHTFLTGEGRIPLGETRLFLERCYAAFPRSGEHEVRWVAWQRAISYLCLTEFLPQVREVFEQGWITRFYMDYSDFEADLEKSLEAAARGEHPTDSELGYFGDAIEEFSHWYGFSAAFLRDLEEKEREERVRRYQEERKAMDAQWRNTGRNEPCPCGSGRKFKKCCLGKPPPQPPPPA